MGSKFFTVLVKGDEPEKLMSKYDASLKVKPYIKYKYLDAEKLKQNSVKILTDIINKHDLFGLKKDALDFYKEKLKAISSMTSFDYYTFITSGMFYDEDGNALSEENPNGKWDKYNLGKNFSYPFKLVDGSESYQAYAKDINWELMHMNTDRVKLFETIWALAIDGDDPSDENEAKLKELWESRKNYLSNFKSADEFAAHNCAYWNYAYLDENGWVDMDDSKGETEWITNFFDRFIEPLDDKAKLTIFEYSHNAV